MFSQTSDRKKKKEPVKKDTGVCMRRCVCNHIYIARAISYHVTRTDDNSDDAPATPAPAPAKSKGSNVTASTGSGAGDAGELDDAPNGTTDVGDGCVCGVITTAHTDTPLSVSRMRTRAQIHAS
jgi:hypothetical protein